MLAFSMALILRCLHSQVHTKQPVSSRRRTFHVVVLTPVARDLLSRVNSRLAFTALALTICFKHSSSSDARRSELRFKRHKRRLDFRPKFLAALVLVSRGINDPVVFVPAVHA